MTGTLIFCAGLAVASIVGLIAWAFLSSVRDLRAEDAARAARVDEQNDEAGR